MTSSELLIRSFETDDQEGARRLIGKAVVERLIELARQHQIKRLQIKTNNDWYEAIGLYKRLGFVEYQRSARGVHMTLEVGS